MGHYPIHQVYNNIGLGANSLKWWLESNLLHCAAASNTTFIQQRCKMGIIIRIGASLSVGQ
jgi:hypothetical protein